jgi:hypothetical protein
VTVTLDPRVHELSRELLADVDALAQRLADRISSEERFYREGMPPGDLYRSCHDNLVFTFTELAGESASLNAPRATGTVRGEQGIPIASVMQGFRIGGRMIWDMFLERARPGEHEMLLRHAADIWAVSDRLSAAVIEAYRDASEHRVRLDYEMRALLLDSLFEGTLKSSAHIWESITLLRLPQIGEFVVVAAECATPGAEALPDIERRLRVANVVSAWRVGVQWQEGIVAMRARYGIERLEKELARARTGRVGLSTQFASLDDAGAALREARVACRAGTPHSNELIRFDEYPLAVLLAGTPEAAETLGRRVLGKVLDLPDKDDRDILLETVRTWLAAAGSSSAAAAQLHIHRNTVRYRLHRVEELTGLDLTAPIDISEIHLALEATRILDLTRPASSG